MKPLLVSYSDIEGGAARAAYRLHQALLDNGTQSRMLVRKKLSSDETVVTGNLLRASVNRFRRPIEEQLVKLQRSTNPVMHSANVVPSRWSNVMAKMGADVVNLHWIGAGALSIADVSRIRAPVVMTLHDMWAFCGAEHYAPSKADSRWMTGYHRSNRSGSDKGLDLDRWVWNRKVRHWKPAMVICPSRWLADLAQASALMAEWPIRVLPHPLDTTVFQPTDRSEARRILGLRQDAKFALFGALGGVVDPRKGFDLLVEALARTRTSESIVGLVMGQNEPQHPLPMPIEIQWLGHIDDDAKMALIYSAADVMVVPSRQEALGQTGTEAQACGTPVVAFDSTGLGDVVAHRETGYLAEPFSTEDLARGINWVIASDTRNRQLGEAARQRSVRLWKPSVVVEKYLAVYREAY